MGPNQLHGYTDNILRVDLTNGETTHQSLDDTNLRKYTGGTILDAEFLWPKC